MHLRNHPGVGLSVEIAKMDAITSLRSKNTYTKPCRFPKMTITSLKLFHNRKIKACLSQMTLVTGTHLMNVIDLERTAAQYGI